jgi:hypothetical protein
MMKQQIIHLKFHSVQNNNMAKTSCEFNTSEQSTKAWFRTKGLIDTFNRILNLNEFRKQNTKWSNYARLKFGTTGNLFLETYGGKKAIPNREVFDKIERRRQEELETTKNIGEEGVSELFESNPELANAVYRNLGFFDSKKQTSRITNEALYDVLEDENEYDIDSLEYLLNNIDDNFSLRLLRLFKGDKKFYINNSISEFGLYNAEDDSIHINTEKHIKNNPNNYNILETIVHELTHRFISFNILGLSQHNNEAKNIVDLFKLEKEGLLEIDCKGLKAEKGLVTSFTKGGKWKLN